MESVCAPHCTALPSRHGRHLPRYDLCSIFPVWLGQRLMMYPYSDMDGTRMRSCSLFGRFLVYIFRNHSAMSGDAIYKDLPWPCRIGSIWTPVKDVVGEQPFKYAVARQRREYVSTKEGHSLYNVALSSLSRSGQVQFAGQVLDGIVGRTALESALGNVLQTCGPLTAAPYQSGLQATYRAFRTTSVKKSTGYFAAKSSRSSATKLTGRDLS